MAAVPASCDQIGQEYLVGPSSSQPDVQPRITPEPGAEEAGIAQDPAHGRLAALPADDVENVPVLDPVADLFEPRARNRRVLARVDEDELAP